MMAKNICLDFQLHYFIVGDDPHAMDAKIHNEAERYLLKAVFELQNYVECDISVRVEAKNEGGIIDNLLLISDKIDILGTLTALLAGFIASFFRPAIHKTDEIKNRIEIAEKIKSGNFSKEEAEILLKSDKQLKKWISKYYETLSKEETISKIEANIPTEDNQNKTATIEKKDFYSHVIQEATSTTTEIINGTTIYIVSPVLVKGRKLPWRGIYSGLPIEFKIDDKDFLKQVYDQEIKFGNGTSITCNMLIETKTTIKDDDIEEVKMCYIVKLVTQWSDDEHFQYETKKYKKIKNEQNQPKQATLFSDDSFE